MIRCVCQFIKNLEVSFLYSFHLELAFSSLIMMTVIKYICIFVLISNGLAMSEGSLHIHLSLNGS